MLVLDEDGKSVHGDLFVRPTIKGSKVKERSNYKMCPNDKSKTVNVLVLDKDAKVTTVISLPDLQLRGQRSKKGQITKSVK